MGVWLCGCLAVWLCGHLCGCLAVWVFGHVGVCVAVLEGRRCLYVGAMLSLPTWFFHLALVLPMFYVLPTMSTFTGGWGGGVTGNVVAAINM